MAVPVEGSRETAPTETGDLAQALTKGTVMTTEARTQTESRMACVHHWMIESPNGRTSAGFCKRCGASRNFANATENVMWEHTNTLRTSPGAGLRSLPRPSEVRLSDEIVDN